MDPSWCAGAPLCSLEGEFCGGNRVLVYYRCAYLSSGTRWFSGSALFCCGGRIEESVVRSLLLAVWVLERGDWVALAHPPFHIWVWIWGYLQVSHRSECSPDGLRVLHSLDYLSFHIIEQITARCRESRSFVEREDNIDSLVRVSRMHLLLYGLDVHGVWSYIRFYWYMDFRFDHWDLCSTIPLYYITWRCWCISRSLRRETVGYRCLTHSTDSRVAAVVYSLLALIVSV